MNYKESIQKINEARENERGAAKELFKAKIESARLLKMKKNFDNRETKLDADYIQRVGAVRVEIQRVSSSLNETQSLLDRHAALSEAFEDQNKRLEELKKELELKKSRLLAVEEKLRSLGDREGRNLLEQEREKLREEVESLVRLLDKLNAKITKIASERNEVSIGALNERYERGKKALHELNNRLESLNENTDQHSDPNEDLTRVKEKLAKAKLEKDNLNSRTRDLIGGLFRDQGPEELIKNWDDSLPILLFPLRIETRFKIEGAKKELWVRIFPDEIAVNTHEEILTDKEVEYGIAYWKAIWAATDDQAKKTAWSMMANKFGSNRSAWVAKKTMPENWSDNVAVESDLRFPEQDFTKENPWSEAPHTRILPDKFVLLAYRDSVLIEGLTTVGHQLDDTVILGPAPLGDDGITPSISQDSANANKLNLGPDFEWVSNFDLAVSKGLGFKIDLNTSDPIGATRGYDELIVVGLKHSADEYIGQKLVEDLFHNHHYSRKGLSLIKQGTPTNNTEASDSGFSRTDNWNETGYYIETGSPLFDPQTTSRDSISDGQRLSEFLGIEYESLQYVANAGQQDHTEASAMNSALYAGTLGYFMNSMLNEVVSEADLKELRYHFKKYVTGRGATAAIRVGRQPYGILLTSAFKKWNPHEKGRRNVVEGSFLNKLYAILEFFEAQWSQVIPEIPHISKGGDSGKNIMDILGLHPTSVEYAQRVGYSYDYLRSLSAFMEDGRYEGDVDAMLIDDQRARMLLHILGYSSTRADGTAKPIPLLLQLIFQHYDLPLEKVNLIDGEPLSESKRIKFYDQGTEKHFIHWLIENASNQEKLEKKDFGTASAPTSLLFMMLVNSLLLETGHSIFKLSGEHNIKADELIRSRKFMNMSTTPSVSVWEVFQAPVNTILTDSDSVRTIFEHVHSKSQFTNNNSHVIADLLDYKESLNILKDMSTASLERAMVEHIDLLTYRLDAWQSSLITRRAEELRRTVADANQRRKGIYIGSYGFLEQVRPGNARRKIQESELPVALREGKENVYTETANGGYVHAPSLNHATAAALLRNAYLTHASPEDKDMMAVNLSSERVRRALYLVDGIRNGQKLESLLGYQFERGLHDWTTKTQNPVHLNHLIPDFRKAFPIKKNRVPQAGVPAGPTETIDDYTVVNGLALAESTLGAPYISGTYSESVVSAIQAERDNIRNTLDALRDLLTAESAYQLAMGNFDRAAAVVRAMAEGNLPPDIEVINTSRGASLSITNRMSIHFDMSISTAHPDWAAIPMSLRATLEPAVNHWLGGMLGHPDNIRCVVSAVDKDGVILSAGGAEMVRTIKLSELGVQPIDLMFLARNKTEESGTSELETRIRYNFAQLLSLEDDVIVRIAFSDNGETTSPPDLAIKAFSEVLPYIDTIRNLMSGSRAANARDYQPASKTLVASSDNPENILLPSIENKLALTLNQFSVLFEALNDALDNLMLIQNEATATDLRERIKAISDAGFSFAFPYSGYGFAPSNLASLEVQARSLKDQYVKLMETWAIKNQLLVNPSTSVKEKTTILISLIRMFVGEDFVVIPRFNFTNSLDVSQSFSDDPHLLDYARGKRNNALVLDEWVQGVSAVRPKMHLFNRMKVYHDALSGDKLTCVPIQLPYRANDHWLAVEYPSGTSIDHDTICYALCIPQGFNAMHEQGALIIDDWVEVVPQREEVTGITYNYNQPNSVPPQALLVAVSPEINGHWEWENLVDTVRDTFRRAKLRAVEPDQIDAQLPIMSKLLPAVISEFSTSKNNISLDMAFMATKMIMPITTFYTLQSEN